MFSEFVFVFVFRDWMICSQNVYLYFGRLMGQLDLDELSNFIMYISDMLNVFVKIFKGTCAN